MESDSELAVVVFPFAAWGDRFVGIPVLHDLAAGNTIKVIERRVDTIEKAFTHRQYEIPLCKKPVESVISNGKAFIRRGHG